MRKRVLFLPIGVGLAHTGRLIMIARELRNLNTEVMFGAGSDAVALLKKENLPYVGISEFTREIYDKKVKKNNFFVYNRHNFSEFVKDELSVYKKVKADLVVFDTRISVKVSTSIAGIPCVSVVNADATGYYDIEKVDFPVQTTLGRYLPPEVISLLNKGFGKRFLNQIGNRAVPAMMIAALIKISPALIKLGYKFKKDPYQFFMGDLTLLADIPAFRPIKALPQNVKLVGPIFWDGGGKLPSWKDKINNNKEIIYVSASGTGDKETFLAILKYLKDTGYTVVATTGNTLKPSEVKNKYRNLFVTDYLPGSFILPRSKLIIFPGGNATCYQALSYGVVQICTPFHVDQEDNANRLERLQTGLVINPFKNFMRNNFLHAVNKVLHDGLYRRNAAKMKKLILKYDGKKKAARIIKRYVNSL